MEFVANIRALQWATLGEPRGLLAAAPVFPEGLQTQLTFGVLGGSAGLFVGLITNLVIARFANTLPEGTLRRALLAAWVGPVRWIIAVLGVYVGLVGFHAWDAGLSGVSAFFAEASSNETNLLLLAELPFLTLVSLRLVDGFCDRWMVRAQDTEDTFDDQLVPLIRQGGKTSLLVAAILLGSQAVGWDVTSLLTGLGIGGAAIALASKDTIANLFGSIVVFVDRPFQ
ncbi:MAG: hypothetical protein ACPHRO_13990, partial [Nannocystaceae bacterium]